MRLARTIPVEDLPRCESTGALASYALAGSSSYPILYHAPDDEPLHPWCAEGRAATWSIFLEGAPVRCTVCRGEYRSAYGLLS